MNKNQEVILMLPGKKITRRGFLKSVGAVSGAAALGGLSLPQISWGQAKDPIKIGFIQEIKVIKLARVHGNKRVSSGLWWHRLLCVQSIKKTNSERT